MIWGYPYFWKDPGTCSARNPNKHILEDLSHKMAGRSTPPPKKGPTVGFFWQSTPPKINIEPENDDLEDDFPFQGCILRFHVNLEGCK